MNRILFIGLFRVVLVFAAFGIPVVVLQAQQNPARPDRGTMPGTSYSLSDFETVSLTNGNVHLSIPLASLPPIAGGKLKFTLSAVYDSKLWNITRSENQLPPLGGCAEWVVNTPQLSDLGGWRINGAYSIVRRNAHEDFDYVVPDPPPTTSCESDTSEAARLQYNYYKTILITPDGAEHELRPVDTNAYYGISGGSRSYLFNYYKDTPDSTGAPMRYYSFDGSFLYVVINPSSYSTLWTIYLNDGTKVAMTSGGIQRIIDTNGNSIKIFSDGNGAHYQDELTGREITYSYDAAANDGKGQGQVHYQTVTGTPEIIYVNFDTTRVQGKIYRVDDWNFSGGETGGGIACFHDQLLTAGESGVAVLVIRSIVFPVTESGVDPRQFGFAYNSDTTESATDTVMWSCGTASTSYTRTVSHGMGELSQMTVPSGAVVNYTYSRDGTHKFIDSDDLARTTVTQKQVTHDSLTDTWSYSIEEYGHMIGQVTGPDGAVDFELSYPTDSSAPMFGRDAKAGLVYRSNRSNKEIVERHWTLLAFSGANTGPAGASSGTVTFNPVVDAEYTTLLDDSSSHNRIKMSAKTYQYDYNGNILEIKDYDWFDPASVTWDSDGLPTGVPTGATLLRTSTNSYYNSANSGTSSNVYAKRSLTYGTPLILSALQETTTGAAIAHFAYDTNSYGTAPTLGNLTSKNVYDDVDNSWITTSMTYDGYGNVVSVTDGRNHTTSYGYDSSTHAQPVSVTVTPNGTDSQTAYTAYDYYTGLVVSTTDVNGQTSTIHYTNLLLNSIDPFGRPGITVSPAVTISGNGNPQPRRVTTKYLDSTRQVIVAADLFAKDDQLLKTRTTSDMLGRPIFTEQTEDGTNYTISARQAYDTVNRMTYASAPMRSSASSTDNWTRVTNDILGRPIEVATFAGSGQPSASPANTISGWTGSVTTAYDANSVTVTDQALKKRKSVSDALGRLTDVFEDPGTGHLNYQTSYDYDVLGNLRHVYQGSQTRTFTYDTMSRLRTAQNPESGTISYVYDENGNLTSKTDARSVTTTYVYDWLNRVTSRSYNDGTAPNYLDRTPTVTYTYDSASISNGIGRLASLSSSVSNYSYGNYDALGRVQSVTQTLGSQTYTTSYNYDLAGHVVSMQYPSGHAVANTYDNAGRLLSFTGTIGDGFFRTYTSGITYGSQGSMQQEQFGTATAVYNKLGYNNRNQLTDIRVSTSGGDTTFNRGKIINDYGTTDNNGNLQKQTVFVPNDDTNNSPTSWYQTFSYDDLNRLTQAHEYDSGSTSLWQQTFNYDRFGNRTIDYNSTTNGIPRPQFDVNANNNRLAVPSGQSGTMTYDNAGNLTVDTYSGTAVSRAYDAENRMLSETTYNSVVAGTYAYDGDGHRVKRIVGSTETWQIYGIGGELIAEYAANGNPSYPQKEYGYRNGQLLITAESGVALGLAPESLAETAATNSSITIGWAANGASNYRVERKERNSNFAFLDHTATASFTDSVSAGSAYLYRVCAADASNNCTSSYSNISLGVAVTFTDANLVGASEDLANATPIKATHINELRTAINAVRYLAVVGDATWTNPTLTPQSSVISVVDVRELRTALNEALTVLHLDTPPFTDPTLVGMSESSNPADATPIKAIHLRELRQRLNGTIGSSCYKSIDQFVKDFYQGVLQRQPSPSELASASGSLQSAQAGGAAALISAAQSFGASLFNSSEYANLGTSNAQLVTDVYNGFLQRAQDTAGYNFWLDQLNNHSYPRASLITAFQETVEFTENVKALCPTAGGNITGSVHWLVADQLGTPRMILDASGSLENETRHDYLPFGEELFAGTGGRTTTQGYSASDGVRQHFTQKERDIETGLDFFEARYYASTQGRFTGVDPFNIALDVQEEAKTNPKKAAAKLQVYLSMPQQWNRYSYAMNNPLLYIDPSGEAIQLSNDKDERERQLQALRDAVGSNAAGYLYANQGSDGNWYVGIYGQNPTNGDTRGFSNTNEVAATFDAIIRDPQVAKLEMVRPGTVTEDGGASADIGAAGRSLLYPNETNGNSPAATGIFKGQLTIKLLDWGKSGLWGKFNLGYLPGALMSDGKDNMVTPSMMVAHELAHAWYQMCGLSPGGSNKYAVDFENKVRKLQNPNGPTRKLHSMPIN